MSTQRFDEASNEVHHMFAAEPRSAREARHWTEQALHTSSGGGCREDDALLVVSELVANAVLHGDGPILLRVRTADAAVRLEVQSSSKADTVEPVWGPTGQTTGRGLRIVEAVSDGWGSEVVDGQLCVWAELQPA